MGTIAVIQDECANVSRRLKLCFVTETYFPEINGVATTVGRLVNGLLARGHRVQLIRPRQHSNDVQRHANFLEVLPQPGIRIPFYRELKLGLPVSHTLLSLWRRQAPDLVHIVTEGPLGNAALRSARRLMLPVSSSFHTNFHSYSRHYGFGLLAAPIVAYLRRFHNRTACTLVPTEELADQLRTLGFCNTRVLARGVDTRLFAPARRNWELRREWGAAPDDPVLLYVGRLAAEKNLELAIQAFQAARAQCSKVRLVLVGDGPLAGKLKAHYPRVIFCGVRTGEELATHYASADIFMFPSLTETFGNVTLEAMASGLAVVAFDYAAAHSHLEQGRSGLLVPIHKQDAFVEAVKKLVLDTACRQRFKQEARRSVQMFEWEKIYRRLEGIFLELVR
jgi:glycosyltransferase involved in cell wall biosynthesis